VGLCLLLTGRIRNVRILAFLWRGYVITCIN
jgi:hypothetical protein